MFMTTDVDVGDEGATFRPNPNMQPIYVKAPYEPELTSQQVQACLVYALTKLEGIYFQNSNVANFTSNSSSYISMGVHTNRGGCGLINQN